MVLHVFSDAVFYLVWNLDACICFQIWPRIERLYQIIQLGLSSVFVTSISFSGSLLSVITDFDFEGRNRLRSCERKWGLGDPAPLFHCLSNPGWVNSL